MLAALAVLAVLSLGDTARGTGRSHREGADAPAGDRLDVRSAALAQSGQDLVFRVHVSGRQPLELLGVGRGRSLCLSVRSSRKGSHPQRACLRGGSGGEGGHVRVTAFSRSGMVLRSARAADARVSTPRAGEVVATIPLRDLALRPGRLRWSVRSAWTGAAPCAGSAAPAPCVDTLPDHGALALTVRAAPVIGCRARAGGAVRSASGRGRRFALTFDDGPGPYTPQIESVLERMHAPATFFVVGVHVKGNEAYMRRALEDGDAIGNHTYNHLDISGAGTTALQQISSTQATIRRATGYTPCLMRPPYGATSASLSSLLNDLGLAQILWNDDPRDWSTPGVGSIESTVLGEASPGGIVIMHDGGGNRSQTVSALPDIIRRLRARGLKLVTIPQLLGFALRR